MLHSQVVDLFNEILDFVTVLTVSPLAAVTDAPVLVVNSDGAALGDVLLCASLNRLLEEMSGICSIIDTQAVVQLVEVDSMLQSAVLGEIFRRNLSVVARHAHGEAEVDSRIGIEASCTEFDRVTQAFRGAMHANDTVVVLDSPTVLSATVGYVSYQSDLLTFRCKTA